MRKMKAWNTGWSTRNGESFLQSLSNCAPRIFLFTFLNHSAWSVQVVAALMMLTPSMRLFGAALIFVSFAMIGLQIRLSLLCPMIMAGTLIYVPQGSLVDSLLSANQLTIAATLWENSYVDSAIAFVLVAHICMLVITHLCLFFNFYSRKRLPERIQAAIDTYANQFGIIIWRVFSADLTNFFVRIYSRKSSESQRVLISDFHASGFNRFRYVCESIALTSLFTTRKYYPDNHSLFNEKLVRYARTLPQDGSLFEFDYMSILKARDCFQYVTSMRFIVDAQLGSVTEEILVEVDTKAPNLHSPVHAAAKPGSYAPQKV